VVIDKVHYAETLKKDFPNSRLEGLFAHGQKMHRWNDKALTDQQTVQRSIDIQNPSID